MSLRFVKPIPALGALAVGLALIGSPAQAALTLTISNAGSASNQSLLITNGSTVGATTGMYDFTGNANQTYNSIVINGVTKTITTNSSGHAIGTFATTNVNSVSFSDNAFGEFTINNLTATRTQTSSDSFVNDTTTDVARNANSQSRSLTISTGTSFTTPNTPTVVLQSAIKLQTNDTNASVALTSTLVGSPSVGVTANQSNPSVYNYART